MKGIVVAFDGLDGSGKSLLSDLVRDALRMREDCKGRVIQTRMPGGTPLGVGLRALLKDSKFKIDPIAERLMFAADNAQFITEVIKPGREEGKLILCDRWSFFTDYCYGMPRGVPAAFLRYIQSMLPQDTLDILFICMPPFETCLQRIERDANRAKTPCRIEKLGTDYLREVWKMYNDASQTCEPKHAARKVIWKQARKVARQVIRLESGLPPVDLCNIAMESIIPLLEVR